MIVEREKYTLEFSDPILYVDNKSRQRSGHMTHAMVEFAPGKVIDFNANCSPLYVGGHSTFGWVEYRISEDGGETFSEIHELPYAKDAFYDGVYVISVEKAVACDDGRIVAFCLRNSAHGCCMPWDTLMTVTSFDGGKSWTEPKEFCPHKGRVYDACVHDGVIYALEFCNDGANGFLGDAPEHAYRLYASYDRGESFEELSVVPFHTLKKGYGAIIFDSDGRLHVFVYNYNDEKHLDHIVSEDNGKTWGSVTTAYLQEGIRNPQIALIDGVYILHGRNAALTGFVLYSSEDCCNWDEGCYLAHEKGLCYYSNNVVLKDQAQRNRLLIQYSECYGVEHCVNVKHIWMRVHKK